MLQTAGPEGLTSTIFPFDAQPRLPTSNLEQKHQISINCMDPTTTASCEHENFFAVLRLKRAMNTATPNKVVAEITPGDEVLVYREEKCWDGPNYFLHCDGRLSVVLDSKSMKHIFQSNMLKLYSRPYLPIKDLLKSFDYTCNVSRNELRENLVEMVYEENHKHFIESRQKENDGTVAKGGARVVNRSNVLKSANFVGTVYVVTIKNPKTSKIYSKRDGYYPNTMKYRHFIANNSPMLMHMSLKINISLAIILFDCTLWLREVKKAFMQSKLLTRSVFAKAPHEAKLSKDNVLRIIFQVLFVGKFLTKV